MFHELKDMQYKILINNCHKYNQNHNKIPNNNINNYNQCNYDNNTSLILNDNVILEYKNKL